MRKIAFIGAYDKLDLITNLAKLLTSLGSKILVIDSTMLQKARYVIPTMNQEPSYVTEFEGFDVAVGLFDMASIKDYLGVPQEQEMEYDIALIDIDNAVSIDKFEIDNSDKNYFVTAFDVYSMKKGLMSLAKLRGTLQLEKVLFSREMLRDEDDYLNYLSRDFKIVWGERRVYFPLENGDQSVIAENQRLGRVRFKMISNHYKDALAMMVEEILENVDIRTIRITMKNI